MISWENDTFTAAWFAGALRAIQTDLTVIAQIIEQRKGEYLVSEMRRLDGMIKARVETGVEHIRMSLEKYDAAMAERDRVNAQKRRAAIARRDDILADGCNNFGPYTGTDADAPPQLLLNPFVK